MTGIVDGATSLKCVVDLTTRLVDSYCGNLAAAVSATEGCDPMGFGQHYARQFFLGNGGCWSIGYTVADNLRTKLPSGKVSRVWHPHDLAGAISTGGLSASFSQLLDNDSLNDADLVHLVSGSGRSANLARATDFAAMRGATVLAHCGHDGDVLRRQVAGGVQVPSFDQQVVEDALLLRLWPGQADDGVFMARSMERLTAAMWTEVPNLAEVALAVADAVAEDIPLGVVAIDTAGVSASAEHVAHNLSWDMCWDMPGRRPQVHFALSNGLLTAVANDSGVDTEPFAHMLRPALSRGIVINLGRERLPESMHTGISQELGISPTAFDMLVEGAGPWLVAAEDVEFLRAALVQTWGHVLVRLGRVLTRNTTDADRFSCAQRPIEPRMERND